MTLLRAIRAAIEAWVPWFDRAAADRSHEITKRVVARADAVIEGADPDRIRRGYGAYGARFRR